MPNKTFKIKKRYVFGLGQWLQGLTLVGRESRERTKFVEVLNKQVVDNELTRIEIVKKYAEKDGEDYKFLEEGDKKNYIIPDGNQEAFQKEIVDFLNEDYSVELSEKTADTVKAIVLDSSEPIKPEVAEDYSHWCEAVEQIV